MVVLRSFEAPSEAIFVLVGPLVHATITQNWSPSSISDLTHNKTILCSTMAKRKVSRAKTAKTEKLWDYEDVAELIVWLDHCLKSSGTDFRESIVSHLKRSRGKEYEISQIERRLKTMRERQLSAEYIKNQGWRDVFSHGSNVLWLLDKEKEFIAQARARLEDHALATLLNFSPSRRLRSASQLAKSPLPLKNQGESGRDDGSRPSRSAKQESEPADLHAHQDLPPAKRRRKVSRFV